MTRKPYISDVSDDEWAFVAPYLTLMTEDAPQGGHSLREVFNGLRYLVHTGAQWRMMPNDLPPWYTVYQQTQRWLETGVFEDMVRDLRILMREIEGRAPQPRPDAPEEKPVLAGTVRIAAPSLHALLFQVEELLSAKLTASQRAA